MPLPDDFNTYILSSIPPAVLHHTHTHGGSTAALSPLALCSVPLTLVIGAGEKGKEL